MAEFLSEDHLYELRTAFETFDKQHTDTIPANELGVIMRALGQKPTVDELDGYIKKYDPTGTGKITLPSFITIMAQKFVESDSPEEIIAAFRRFDHDNDGYLSVEELKHVMMNMGEKMPEDEVDEMIREADSEGTGQFNYEEFVRRVLEK